MRGADLEQTEMFSYIPLERRIPSDHPLRPIREITGRALEGLSRRFDRMYAETGRPSIPPERLLRALLLQILYTLRSERQLMEQLDYNLLFGWFVGLNPDDEVWDVTVFTKNRDRLLRGEVAEAFFDQVLGEARERELLSAEHFTVDGTLLEAWASLKSFQNKEPGRPQPPDDPGNPTLNFHGERRSNATHESKTDAEARLARKGQGKEAKLCYQGHVLMDNRHGLVVNTRVTQATGRAEVEAALEMVEEVSGQRRVTVGADKGYDQEEFVAGLRSRKVRAHVAQKKKGSALDGRTTDSVAYTLSQWKRKRVEEVFGWMKTVGLLRKLRHRGLRRVGWIFTLTAAAYNLIRIRNLSLATT